MLCICFSVSSVELAIENHFNLFTYPMWIIPMKYSIRNKLLLLRIFIVENCDYTMRTVILLLEKCYIVFNLARG